MIEELVIYRCTKCGKTYENDPLKCICEKKNVPGKVVGPFRLIEKTGGWWKVKCLFCTQVKNVHPSNLKRMQSCGCVPKSIEIFNNSEDFVRYKCKKCFKTTNSPLPVIEWCCEEEEE